MDTQNIKQWIVDNAKGLFIFMIAIIASIAFFAVTVNMLDNYWKNGVLDDTRFQEAIKNPCYREQAKNLLVGGKSHILIREHDALSAKCRKSHADLVNSAND